MGVRRLLEEIQYELIQKQPKLEFQGSRIDKARLNVSIGTCGNDGMRDEYILPWPPSIPNQCSSLESAAPGGTQIYCAGTMLNTTLNWPNNSPSTQYGQHEATRAERFLKVDLQGTSWAVRHISHCQQWHHQYSLPVCVVKFFSKSGRDLTKVDMIHGQLRWRYLQYNNMINITTVCQIVNIILSTMFNSVMSFDGCYFHSIHCSYIKDC